MLVFLHILQEDCLATNIFLIHIQLPIFPHFLQKNISMLPDLYHTSSLSLIHSCIELKLAGGRRWHFSLERLRNPLAPTSNQPSKSFIPFFLTSLTSVSPSLLPLSLLWFKTQLAPAWVAAATASFCSSYIWLLPSAHLGRLKQPSHCFHHSPALKPLGAPHCLSSEVQPKLRVQTLCVGPSLPS